ncbi:SgrR family transcriptional regulator [Vibrio sp. ZSDZ65]|uniref:SgrR family transcriptional regulator n=1 Tax=Vibrio qingdaonensis TaxID=2829491 RepID=A0A9X3CNS3_9VIBR|nr:SgrR family transcriptional regulator [Vibrio qingdaonensis]MCW8346782.1 SgrR family transcriptional regulator [Vibrio qingdaonensis]
MESSNLFRYYSRLLDYPLGQECKVLLGDVAEDLFTSPRHARTLLKQMTELGWVNWRPQSGRNQRSTLARLYSAEEVKKQVAKSWVTAGKYEKALDFLDGDQVLFGTLLQQTSGAVLKEGRVNVQLTYDRSFERLVPHKPQRNSERFLIRQLYSCLVSMGEDGNLQPELAHYWQSEDSFRRWSFHLRPGLQFDNGDAITAQVVCNLLLILSKLPFYKYELDHVMSVEVVHDLKFVVTLAQPDRGFCALLSDLKYSIQPPQQLNDAWSLTNRIVGSGVFLLQEHTDQKVSLLANERYFSLRALTDEVTIWLLNNKVPDDPSVLCEHALLGGKVINTDSGNTAPAAPLIDVHNNNLLAQDSIRSHSMTPTQYQSALSHHGSQIRIEDGCLFLLFNQNKRTQCLGVEQRKWLSECLRGEEIWQALVELQMTFGAQVAHNFFPFWHQVKRIRAMPTDLPSSLTIAVYDHRGLIRCSRAIQSILASLNVTVSIAVLPHREFLKQAREGVLDYDLVLTNFNLDDNRQVSAMLAFASDPVIESVLSEESNGWLRDQLNTVRESIVARDYLEHLEPICSALIYEGYVSPMFHHRQTLSFHGVIKGVEITTWGWPQLREVWSDD